MDTSQLQLLSEQYHDYFIVEHPIRINVKTLDGTEPDQEQFERQIPEPFRMAGELASLDQSALKSLNQLGELAEELSRYLRLQAKKIDAMMRYILLQQDEAQHRLTSHSYGGSALCFDSPAPIEPGSLLEVKMFLQDSDGAVYALLRTIDCTPIDCTPVVSEDSDTTATTEPTPVWRIKATYTRIREQDRELIVRASLHQQSRQLKRKAELRAQQGSV